RIRFRQLLASFSENRIVLLSTHVVEDIESSCREVTVLTEGSVPFQGSIALLAEQARGKVWTAEVDNAEWRAASQSFRIVSAVAKGSRMSVRFLAESPPLAGAEEAEPTMEDGYLC